MQTAYGFRIHDPKHPKIVQYLVFVWIESRSKIKEWGLYPVNGKVINWKSPNFHGEAANVTAGGKKIVFPDATNGDLELEFDQPITSLTIGAVGSLYFPNGIFVQAYFQYKQPYTEKAAYLPFAVV